MTLRMVFLFTTLATVAVIHVFALEFSLYWRYLWLDIPMHFFAGVACAFGFSILPFFHITLLPKLRTASAYVGFGLAVGILWEIFEYHFGIMGYEENLVLDTAEDLVLDSLGALMGYLIVRRSNEL